MRKGLWALCLLALALPACLPASSPGPRAATEIEIASDFPTTPGPFGGGQDGLALQHAVELAVQRHPTVRGLRIAVRAFDESGGAYPEAKASQVAQEATANPRILGVIGPLNSYAAAFQIPIANAADLPMIGPSTTWDCLTMATTCPVASTPLRPSGHPNFFRLAPPDSTQGAVMAHFALQALGVRRVAVMSDGTIYGHGVAAGFLRALGQGGGIALAYHDFDPSVINYVPWLSEARAAGAQAIYAAGSSRSRTCAVREQAKQVFTSDVFFLGPDGIVTSECLQQAADNLSGQIYGSVAAASPSEGSTAARQLIDMLRRQYPADHQPQPYSISTYDATMILIDAIGRAIDAAGGKVPTRRQVLKALAATHAYAGVAETYSFTAAGDNAGAVISVYQVQHGAWALLRTVPVGEPAP